MTYATALAAALAERHVAAVPVGEAVRAWISGTGRGYLLITPAAERGQPVWAWQHGGKAGRHARDDISGAAAAIIEFLAGNPP